MGERLSVFRVGMVDYPRACRLQEEIARARAQGTWGDTLLLVQHPPVITVGRGGGWEDILVPASFLEQQGIQVWPTDRGGKATYHGPGQLVVYPILKIRSEELHDFVWRLEEVVIRLLRTYDLDADRLEEHPGVWINGRKIAALGLAVSNGVTRHGLALNVSPQLAHFGLLIPCGVANRGVTSMERELGRPVDLEEVSTRFVQTFARVFDRVVMWGEPAQLPGWREEPAQHPVWLWRQISPQAEAAVEQVEDLLADLRLHTVCQEARCPNLAECFGQGTAAFLILGDRCTRACRFCAVGHGAPQPVDETEPERVAEAASRLGLQHVVITSVTRDDLPDGGAGVFAATVHAVRRRLPDACIEVLIPDLGGSYAALETILISRPDVLNHNLETVPRLYPLVRPRADYRRSLSVLAQTKALAPQIVTKSGLMMGLGERVSEVLGVLSDLRAVGCDLLTLGQYLQPTEHQLPVVRYLPPEEFDWYRDKAESMGFAGVASGPLVRSSHQAGTLLARARRISGGASVLLPEWSQGDDMDPRKEERMVSQRNSYRRKEA